METREEILDSGLVYKDPENDREILSYIEIDVEEEINPEETPIFERVKHYSSDPGPYRKVITEDGEMMTFKPLDKKSHLYLQGVMFFVILFFFFTTWDLMPILQLILVIPSSLVRSKQVFNKTSGIFWKKGKFPSVPLFYKKDRMVINLKDIKAVQILKFDQNGPFINELNMVLADNSRLNIVVNKEIAILEQDASELAKFLEVPLLSNFNS